MLERELTCMPTRFREPAERGPYLWDWANECGLRGLGYTPTSMGGHHFITLAALRVLPDVVRWLRGEARLLTWSYCGFPDMNWAQYGTFGTECGGARMPDSRREWEISHYCRYNQLLDQGHFIGHHPKQAIEGVRARYADACKAAEDGLGRDAMRFLGAAVHYLEDCGSPPHAAEISGPLHMPAESVRDPSLIDITGYQPAEAMDFQATVDHLEAFAVGKAAAILAFLEDGHADRILPLQIDCANECAKAVADFLNQFYLACHTRLDFQAAPAEPGVELLHNGDFSRPGDDPFVPDGWCFYWEDRTEHEVEIERVETSGETEILVRHAVERVACLPTWPRVTRGVPGQTFVLTGDVLCADGEAGLEAICTDDATCPLSETRERVTGSGDWEQLALRITLPEGGEVLRPGVYARHLNSPARFRNLSLRTLED